MLRALANCVVCLAFGCLIVSPWVSVEAQTREGSSNFPGQPPEPETDEDLRAQGELGLGELPPRDTEETHGEAAVLAVPTAEEVLPSAVSPVSEVEGSADPEPVAPASEERAWLRGSLSAGLLSAPESGDLGIGATLGAAALLGDELSLGGTLMVGIVPSDDDRANRVFGGLNLGPTFSGSLGDFRFSCSLEAGLFGGSTQATKLQVGFLGSIGVEVAAEVGDGLALTLGARSIVLYADSPHGLALIALGLSYDET